MADKKLPPQEEEVDLGNLFKVIGKGIKSFFEAIIFLLERLYYYLIRMFIFLKRHSIYLGSALVLGFIIGLVLHKMQPKEYTSKLLVETNFNSGMQLYKQIEYLNDLVKKKDSSTLAQILNISTDQAAALKDFNVEAYESEKIKYQAYDEYMQKTDTIYTKDFTFDDFKKRIKDADLRFHEIQVVSTQNDLFRNLTPSIVVLIENEYFKNRMQVEKNAIVNKLSILYKNLSQIDSLRNLYKEVALKEAERPIGNSTIEIAQPEYRKEQNDITLFNISNELLSEIEKTNREIIRKNKIVNIISDFDEIGVPEKRLTHKKYFQMAMLFFGLTLAWILFRRFLLYLDNYR